MAHGPCEPEWHVQHPNKECPFGWVFGAPVCPLTVPNELTFWNSVACAYSFLPVAVVVGNAVNAFFPRCSVRWLCLLIFSLIVGIPHALLKLVILGPRPEGSCLLDCGMPSGHSGFAAGMFCVLLAECWRDAPSARIGRAGQVAALAVSLLPIGWSRVALRDHSLPQVLVGSAVGVAGAGLWIVCFGPFFEAFLARALGEATPSTRQSAGAASAREPVLDLSLLEMHGRGARPATEATSHSPQAAHAAGSCAPAAPAAAARAAPKKAGGAASERTWHALQEDSQDSAQDSH